MNVISLCWKYLSLVRFAHSWEILSALEDKIRILTRPCNILYIYDWRLYYSYKWKLKLKAFLVVLQNVTLFQEEI